MLPTASPSTQLGLQPHFFNSATDGWIYGASKQGRAFSSKGPPKSFDHPDKPDLVVVKSSPLVVVKSPLVVVKSPLVVVKSLNLLVTDPFLFQNLQGRPSKSMIKPWILLKSPLATSSYVSFYRPQILLSGVLFPHHFHSFSTKGKVSYWDQKKTHHDGFPTWSSKRQRARHPPGGTAGYVTDQRSKLQVCQVAQGKHRT